MVKKVLVENCFTHNIVVETFSLTLMMFSPPSDLSVSHIRNGWFQLYVKS